MTIGEFWAVHDFAVESRTDPGAPTAEDLEEIAAIAQAEEEARRGA